jgi:hypothetical protein
MKMFLYAMVEAPVGKYALHRSCHEEHHKITAFFAEPRRKSLDRLGYSVL